jgi:hypothetical protein
MFQAAMSASVIGLPERDAGISFRIEPAGRLTTTHYGRHFVPSLMLSERFGVRLEFAWPDAECLWLWYMIRRRTFPKMSK